MKLRCDIHLESGQSKLLLVARPEEKLDHLALKLAAYLMFLKDQPVVEPSSDHPSLYDYDLRPDILAVDEGGDIRLWIECGEVSLNKLDKVSRRLTRARVVVLKATAAQARRLRETLNDEVRNGDKVEIWYWPDGKFTAWLASIEEKVDIFGEAHEKSFNLVVNETPFAVDLAEV